MSDRVLIRYVTRPDGNTRKDGSPSRGVATACVAATRVGEEITLGWSLCRAGEDRFDKKVGRSIAISRARSGHFPATAPDYGAFKYGAKRVEAALRKIAEAAGKFFPAPGA